jgi:hypothetical protein
MSVHGAFRRLATGVLVKQKQITRQSLWNFLDGLNPGRQPALLLAPRKE